jgi:hypothetical protein
MPLEEIKLVKIWHQASEILHGKLDVSFKRRFDNSHNEGLYRLNLDLIYKNIPVNIHSAVAEFSMIYNQIKSFPIAFSIEKETNEIIELSIWRKDFIDRIFKAKSLQTGYAQFDKVFGLKASKNIKPLLSKIFENNELREALINDNYGTFNIQTTDHKLNIQRKSVISIKEKGILERQYREFCLILDGLIDSGVI